MLLYKSVAHDFQYDACTWTSPDGKTHNQIDHILLDRRRHSNILDVLSCSDLRALGSHTSTVMARTPSSSDTRIWINALPSRSMQTVFTLNRSDV
jgi:hypothetical protein